MLCLSRERVYHPCCPLLEWTQKVPELKTETCCLVRGSASGADCPLQTVPCYLFTNGDIGDEWVLDNSA